MSPQAVTFNRLSNGNVILSWSGGNLEIEDEFDSPSAIEQVRFADGTIWQLATMRYVTLGSGEHETLYGNTAALGSRDDTIRGMDGNDTIYAWRRCRYP